MDTTAYLTYHGWAGHGHALHHSGRGIIKPIAVSQKNNVLGVGKKKHDAHADQWWARAFDETLKGLNVAKDGASGRTEGVVVTGAAKLAGSKMRGGFGKNAIGLYSCFVRGEGLGGTLREQEVDAESKDLEDRCQTDRARNESENEASHIHLEDKEEKRKKKKKKKKKRKVVQTQDTKLYSLQRVGKNDKGEQAAEPIDAAPKEKERKKRRKEADPTNGGHEPMKSEFTEEERRKQIKKARKVEKARLAAEGERFKNSLESRTNILETAKT